MMQVFVKGQLENDFETIHHHSSSLLASRMAGVQRETSVKGG